MQLSTLNLMLHTNKIQNISEMNKKEKFACKIINNYYDIIQAMKALALKLQEMFTYISINALKVRFIGM